MNLWKDGKSKSKYIHRAVLEAFIGPCPEGMECRHLDRDKYNNRLPNLCWGTSKENGEDQVRHGVSKNPAKAHHHEHHPLAKIDRDKSAAIQRLLASGMSQMQIASRFGVVQSVISQINLGKHWTCNG